LCITTAHTTLSTMTVSDVSERKVGQS